jgi:hypothetical protein
MPLVAILEPNMQRPPVIIGLELETVYGCFSPES